MAVSDDEEDKFFNPRIRWASENGDEILASYKRQYEDEVRLLKFIAANPGLTGKDIREKIAMGEREFRVSMNSLRLKNIRIKSQRGWNTPSRYTLEGEVRFLPIDIPKWSKYR